MAGHLLHYTLDWTSSFLHVLNLTAAGRGICYDKKGYFVIDATKLYYLTFMEGTLGNADAILLKTFTNADVPAAVFTSLNSIATDGHKLFIGWQGTTGGGTPSFSNGISAYNKDGVYLYNLAGAAGTGLSAPFWRDITFNGINLIATKASSTAGWGNYRTLNVEGQQLEEIKLPGVPQGIAHNDLNFFLTSGVWGVYSDVDYNQLTGVTNLGGTAQAIAYTGGNIIDIIL
jgi:hypothetical protein